MKRATTGALLALILIQSDVLAQAPCGDAGISIAVWRGSAPSTEVGPADDGCLEGTEGEPRIDEVLGLAELGVPGLDEILTLVLEAGEEPGTDPAMDADGLPSVQIPLGPRWQTGTRAVLIEPEADGEAGRIVHLNIVEATPLQVDVHVRYGPGELRRLSWSRTPLSPEWSPTL